MPAIQEAVEQFKTYCQARNLSPNTLRAYASDLRDFTAFVGAADLNRKVVRNFLAHLHTKKLSRTSTRRKLAAIKSFFKWLQSEGMIVGGLLESLSSPRPHEELPDVPTEADMSKLLDGDIPTSAPERDRVILEMLYGSGLRAQELVDIDLQHFCEKDVLLVRGKGDKERMVPVGGCAQRAIEVWLPVRAKILQEKRLETPALLFDVGQTLYNIRLAKRESVPDVWEHCWREYGPDGEVTCRSKMIGTVKQYPTKALALAAMIASGNRRSHSIERLNVRQIGRIVKAVALAKGLPAYNPHLLRHACGTHCHDRGMPLQAVAQLLGHARLSATQIYTRVSTGRMKDVYKRAHPHAKG